MGNIFTSCCSKLELFHFYCHDCFCITVVTETTGSVSGRSITSELNDELNDLIQRFHNQLHDSQVNTRAHIAKLRFVFIKSCIIYFHWNSTQNTRKYFNVIFFFCAQGF